MTDPHQIADLLDTAAQRRAARRRFLQLAGGAAVATGGLSLLAACGGDDSPSPTPSPSPSPSPTATSTTNPDIDALNFALQLEYLTAQFFARAATGAGLPDASLTGTGTAGVVTGGRQAPLTGTLAAAAREIARDDAAHVAYLRAQLAADAVAQPAINIDGGSSGAFTALARAAGVVGASDPFDPYASEENFLYAAFALKDVAVTAYKGLVPVIATASYLAAGAGILAAESYHAGFIRTQLYARGLSANAGRISDRRDAYDGASDFDQGIAGADATVANITPADGNGVAFSRTTGQVLNILYLNAASVGAGGFFPAGLNGALKTSAASG